MSNLLAMMNTGVSGIFAAQVQIDLTGHNIANIDNPNYSQQRANLESSNVRHSQYGTFGTGVKVESVSRIYDEVLAKTVRNENSSLQYWTYNQMILQTVRVYFNEMETGSGLGESIQNYFNAWQDLGNIPADNSDESAIKRTQVMETAKMLCTKINEDRAMFEQVKDTIDYNIKGSVDEINNIARSISELNKKITSVEADGSNANDLRDTRDGLLMNLSQLVNTSVVERPNGDIGVYIAGEPIVDGQYSYKLEVRERESDGRYDIVWRSGDNNDRGTVISSQLSGGVLQSAMYMRDDVVNKYIGELDKLASTLIYETNKLHASGQGLTKFTQLSSSNTVEDSRSRLSTAYGDLPFDVTKGTFQVKVYADADNNPKTPDTLVGTYDVTIDPANDTLAGIAEKISSADGSADGGAIQAYVTPEGALKITSSNGNTFAFGEDTSGFLVAAGFNNFFSGTDASTIEVEQRIQDNVNFISNSATGVEGNNTVGLLIAELKHSSVVDDISIEDFYSYFVGKIATDKQQVDTFVATKTLSHNSYYEKLQRIRGVSMEEESAKLIQFQRILQANSRFVTAIDEMLNVIINGMGLVGR